MTSRNSDSEYTPLAEPLFGVGDTRPRDRLVNTVIVLVTCVFVLITTISAFIPYKNVQSIFFALCIIMICSSHLALIIWYRQGDLDPKFKKLIYYNTLNIFLLCLCAMLFFY